jgi:hypothetical protein
MAAISDKDRLIEELMAQLGERDRVIEDLRKGQKINKRNEH